MNKALITGANKGLGFETARYLLQNGFFIFLGCRHTTRGQEALARLKDEGLTNCTLIEIDITSQQSVEAAHEKISAENNSLDALINNAGILGRIPTPDNPLTVADIEHVFNTNLFGTIRVTETFLPLLRQSAHPRIVNVTSDLASLTLHQDPAWEYFRFKGIAYGPSKSALNAYTVALAFQLKDSGIKVNCVTPGHTATDFNNYRGKLRPEDTCKVIAKYAMPNDDIPTGKFLAVEEELPW